MSNSLKSEYFSIFGPKGVISKKLDNYEFREEQLHMACSVASSLENESHLLIEASTGVGKSFAYLVPFMSWAYKNDKKFVVSTFTKTLQEQLAKKDLPILNKILDNKIKFALCFGSENYLCKKRLYRISQAALFDTEREAKEINMIFGWSESTKTGLLTELPFIPLANIWPKISREPYVCKGKRCSYKKECFFNKAKKQQKDAHVLITNHSLFFSNINAEGQLLPNFDGVIFDEAHNIENIAASHFGFEITNTQLLFLLDELKNPRRRKGFLYNIKEIKDNDSLMVLTNAARQATERFFDHILSLTMNRTSLRLYEPHQLDMDLSFALNELVQACKEVSIKIDDEDMRLEFESHILKLKTWNDNSVDFIDQKRERHVYWLETESKGKYFKHSLIGSPIDVSSFMRRFVFEKISPVILTSASLTINNSFNYIKERIGVPECNTENISSPFDFKKQAVLFIPQDIPDPVYEPISYINEIAEKTSDLVKLTNGRTFVLFTSYAAMNKVFLILESYLPSYHLLKQGDLPRWQLLQTFIDNKNTVLLGTASFWQGVDIIGDKLESVIITKLPFAVPDHPLTEARILDLESQERNPFFEYQVPSAVLLFKQGFGRLIRHRNDIGIVTILDPRISKRSYGKFFINSLPECNVVNDFSSLEKIYKGFKA